MQNSQKRGLDGAALYAALDAKRQSCGISWQQAACEVGAAASTLQNTRKNGPMETDGILAMVRWLECPLEDFVRGIALDSTRVPSTPSGRFNNKALDARRRDRGMTWTEAGKEIGGLPPSMLTRLAKGGRIGVDVMLLAVGWLECVVDSFTHKAGD
jgi:hypothetical protein